MAVTTDNVADRLGRPRPTSDSPQARQWQLWIEQADKAISRYQTRNGLPVPDPDTVEFVILEVVAAMVRHPDDSTTVSVQVDDGSTSRTYESGNGSINLDHWWDYLWPDSTADSEAFSVRPAYTPDDRWCW